MASILKITDGTTTVDFISDSAYRLLDWSPAVASRRESLLAGRGPYTDVVEEMRIFIGGSTPLAKLATLRKLIDQAERWSRGENVTAVSIHVKATSSSSELTAVIYGPPSPGDEAIILPGRFMDAAVVTAIDPVVLRFKRAGLWLGPDEVSATSSTLDNPTVGTISLSGTAESDSPYVLEMTGIPWNESAVWNSFILATSADTTANAAKKLAIFEAEVMTNTGTPTSVSDTGSKARGSNVLRFTFGSAFTYYSGNKDISSIAHPDVRRWSIFVSCRNNSAVNFQVRAFMSTATTFVYTPKITIPANANNNDPFWLYLGQMSLRSSAKKFYLSVEADGAGTLDFDSVAILAADNPVTDRAVAILADEESITGETLSSASGLALNHALDFSTQPYVYVAAPADVLFQSYNGNPALFVGADEPAVAVAWLACGRYNTSYWRATNTSGTVISNLFGAVRSKGQTTVT